MEGARLEGSLSQAGLQPQRETPHKGTGPALQCLKASQGSAMGLIHLLCQLALPCAGGQRGGESLDTDGIAQREPGQPFIADAPQGISKPLIIFPGDPIGIVLPKFGLKAAEHVPNQGKLQAQDIATA